MSVDAGMEPQRQQPSPTPTATPETVGSAATAFVPPKPGNQAVARLLSAGGEGTPLPPDLRRQAERSFGRDLSAVRLHETAASRAAVGRLDAMAATYGADIHMGTAAPPLRSSAGWQLLVHELTHVVQQAGTQVTTREHAAAPVRVSTAGEPAERAATAVAEGRASARAVQGTAAGGVVHRLPVGMIPQPPPSVLPPGLIAQQASRLAGEVAVDGASLGEGTFVALQRGVTLVGGTTVSEGTVTVGAITVGADATVLGGGTATAVGIGGAAAAGIVVVGALLVAGAILFVAVAASEHQELADEPGKEPGTKDLLPGGAPPAVIAPAQEGGRPVQAPGATSGGSVKAPAGTDRGPARLPAAPTAGPVRAPGVVDDPDECRRLIAAHQDHWHHIFPREYVNEFDSIGIDIDDFTVKLPWNKHIGRGGIHINLDWNDRWGEFFDQVPNDLTDQQRRDWAYKAIDLAVDLMGEMRQYLRDQNLRRLVKYKTNTPSPAIPPKTPAK